MSITSERAADVLGMAVTFNGCGRSTSDELREAVSAAIAALREKAERENPKPLTLEELRKMDGEPVWVNDLCTKAHSEYCVISIGKPMVFQDIDHYNAAYIPGVEHTWYEFCDYGREWIAYRHKPKEVTK